MKWLYLLMIVLMATFAIAKPPFIPEPETLNEFLFIEMVDIQIHPIDTYLYLHTHLFDGATGLPLNVTNSRCEYHLYAERINWEHLISDGVMEAYGKGFFSRVNESYFNETGEYTFLIDCYYNETGTATFDFGGFKQLYITVYDDTEKDFNVWTCPTEQKQFNYLYLVIALAVIFIIIAAIKSDMWIFGTLAGLMLVGAYFFIGACAPLITMPLLLIGILISVYFAS